MLKLFWTFFKIGAFTLGGGYAMLPLIQSEITEKNKWLDEATFIELLALAQASPGPIAVNSAVFIGYKIFGIAGALTACLGIVLPSFIIILVIVMFLTEYRNSRYAEAFFKALKPAITAMILAPLYSMAKKMKIRASGIVIAVISCLLVAIFTVSPAYIITACVLLGLAAAVCGKSGEEKAKQP